MNIRKRIKESERGILKYLKDIYYRIKRFSIPAPRFVFNPLWQLINIVRKVYYWILGVFFVTPIFKGTFKKANKGFIASTFLPYIKGNGHIYVGKNLRINGKVDFIFGSIKEEIPEIHIGDNCGIGHRVIFDICGKLTIGDDCLIARDVNFQDCGGHPMDPELRKSKKPPSEKDVKSITVGNNVWIGTGVHIFPGAKIGDNCVIAARSVVARRIPPNHYVYSTPSKILKIRQISKMS
jgi:maltose O-acetyltransferase